MKKAKFIPILFAFFITFICMHRVQAQVAGKGLVLALLGGDGTLLKYHKEAMASLDLIKKNDKGESYIEDKDQPKVSYNIGILIAEGITFGGAKANGFGYKTQRIPAFGNASALPGGETPNFPAYATEAKMNGRFYLSEGLEFITKATKDKSGNFTESSSLSYLQIPLLFNYIYGLQQNTSAIHGGLGVYAAIGLFGKIKGDNFSQSVHFGSSANDDLKRMDYGIAINAGYMFLKHWDVNLNYDLGVRNVSTTPPDPDSHIKGFSLNFGFWIN